MADGTNIEWADATLNYLNGCTVLSRGCTNCYAMKLAGTRLRNHPSRQGLTIDTKAGPVWTGDVRPNEPALLQALAWKRGRKIFWNAHGDTFHENVPDEWIDRLFAVCALTPQHTHMILTKRSTRMREYMAALAGRPIGRILDNLLRNHRDPKGGWPGINFHADVTGRSPEALRLPLPNVLLGVSVEDQITADHRIVDLLNTPAAVRFVSAEPLLGPLDLTRICKVPPVAGSVRAGVHIDALAGKYIESGARYVGDWDIDGPYPDDAQPRSIDWVIVGGEHGPRPMHPDWARSLRDQCAAAGVAFMFKQWGDFGPHGLCAEKWIVGHDGGHKSMPTPNGIGHHAPRDGSAFVYRVGKKRAGRLLDGRTHDEFPQAALETCP